MNDEFKGNILVTGGAGFIGSHTVVELLQIGFNVVVVDNLENSSEESLRRVGTICKQRAKIIFRKVDINDFVALSSVFEEFSFTACIHFAGAKSVAESVTDPMKYYNKNVAGTVNLVRLLDEHNCKNIVVSSSCTVYGMEFNMPLTENAKLGATNPYGRSKHMIEQILQDVSASDKSWNIIILRYFNPTGAHPSGLIGEHPRGIPTNLMPIITQVAVGRRQFVSIFGFDYDTPDGTAIRDYVHVVDIARGHVAALHKLSAAPGCVAVNLGTGTGTSVLEMVKAMSRATGIELSYEMLPRRAGDVPVSYADPLFAKKFLGWEAKLNLDDMCTDSWRWQSQFPNGYEK